MVSKRSENSRDGWAIEKASRSKVPRTWAGSIDSVLITGRAIARRVRELATLVQNDCAGRELVIVSILNGTVMFVADLIRGLSIPLQLDFVGVSSYRHAMSPGKLQVTKDLVLDIQGREVLLVDDILDSGRTLGLVVERLQARRPASLRVCVLLEKRVTRATTLGPDYIGFSIPDRFVVGYGLDYAQNYRNLPFIGTIRTGPVRRRP